MKSGVRRVWILKNNVGISSTHLIKLEGRAG